ncbi:hypothetical protein FACS189492_0490 [Clostridia bacterium]|nr:hypothetical protein FACS189492_0490 [Clostridia bacterium]
MKRKIERPERLVIEIPLEGFTPEKLENLKKLVDSKATLLKKVLGTEELPIETTEETVQFPWFSGDLPAEEIQAYSQFIAALCDTAKKKARIVARPQAQFENEKFAMRVWLIGLGMKGAEHALCRKLMMKNLTGDSSWRYSKPESGEPRQRRERVQRDVVSARFTPDTLAKLAELASAQEPRMSRNMLIESVIEEYVRAAFPAPAEGEPAAEEVPAEPAETPLET